jgi:hypothetical protein
LNFVDKIFKINSENEFNELALSVFRYQFENIPIYNTYINSRKVSIDQIRHYSEIPFLPIQFFKSHEIIAKNSSKATTFLSSGTTNQERSKHFVHNLDIYKRSFTTGFQNIYGDVKDQIILALLPSYKEQGNSSLIYMVDQLIKESDEESGYLEPNSNLTIQKILKLKEKNVSLIGVSYALIDLIENFDLPSLKNWNIIETGGMKGRKKELIREELHEILQRGFETENIHSEYGMTELLSQAYSTQNGKFKSPPWMKFLTRELEDPFTYCQYDNTGGLNIIDLANIYSCSFIETQDLGRMHKDGTVSILGRFDQAEIRGCNLLTFS